jgi:hypothetical protein
MRGFWSEPDWRFDDDALVRPNGQRATLKRILQWRADLIDGRFDLTGRAAFAENGYPNVSCAQLRPP